MVLNFIYVLLILNIQLMFLDIKNSYNPFDTEISTGNPFNQELQNGLFNYLTLYLIYLIFNLMFKFWHCQFKFNCYSIFILSNTRQKCATLTYIKSRNFSFHSFVNVSIWLSLAVNPGLEILTQRRGNCMGINLRNVLNIFSFIRNRHHF